MFVLFATSASAFYHPHEEKSFLGWMRESNQLFTGEDYHSRFGIWMSNNRLVQEHNAGQTDFTISMNHLSHLTPSEYRSMLGFKPTLKNRIAKRTDFIANEAVDWRQKGIVNPIKDQTPDCGSCWAFSTCQAQESQWAKTHGTLYRLSESNLVDCVKTCGGCDGGVMDAAYDYVIKYQDGMFMKEEDYPYVPRQGACKFDKKKGTTKVTGYMNVVEGSEEDLASKISQYGVAAIAIDASHWSFQLYHGGIYDEKSCSPQELDHAVGCVGYGSENGKDFWIVRNSWGEGWGEKGYIRMVKGKGNQCGEASYAMIPIDA